jgi:hypothetical protein
MRTALILGSALMLGACNISADAQEAPGGGGGTAKRDFQVGAFDKVSLAGSHNVVVTVGGAPSVRAEGDPKVLDRLDIRVDGGSSGSARAAAFRSASSPTRARPSM